MDFSSLSDWPQWLIGLVIFLQLAQMFKEPLNKLLSARVAYFSKYQKVTGDVTTQLRVQKLQHDLDNETSKNKRLQIEFNVVRQEKENDKAVYGKLNIKLVDLAVEQAQLNRKLVVDKIKESESILLKPIQALQASINELKNIIKVQNEN